MPREARAEREEAGATVRTGEPGQRVPVWAISASLREALRPWVDVDVVGPAGLETWLLTVLPMLPLPSVGDRVVDRDVSRGTPEERLTALAHALADCASDRARTNFQAAEYFRENRVLARRVKALEAMVRTRQRSGRPRDDLPDDPDADRAVERYLPADRR